MKNNFKYRILLAVKRTSLISLAKQLYRHLLTVFCVPCNHLVGENFNFILLNWVDKKRCSYNGMNESSTNIWMDLPPFKPNWDPLYSTPFIHTTNVPSLLFPHRFHHLLTLSLHPSIVSWQAGAFWQITQYFLSDLYPNPTQPPAILPSPKPRPPNSRSSHSLKKPCCMER